MSEVRFYILWEPSSSYPPTQKFTSLAQAQVVADKMAEANPGKRFYVCETVAYSETERKVTRATLQTPADKVKAEVDALKALAGSPPPKPSIPNFGINLVPSAPPWTPKVGDEVVTSYGIRGKVTSLDRKEAYVRFRTKQNGLDASWLYFDQLRPYARNWGTGFVKLVDTPLGKGAMFENRATVVVPSEAKFVIVCPDKDATKIDELLSLEKAANPYRYGTQAAIPGYRVYAPVDPNL